MAVRRTVGCALVYDPYAAVGPGDTDRRLPPCAAANAIPR